jgi:hypothetical protein
VNEEKDRVRARVKSGDLAAYFWSLKKDVARAELIVKEEKLKLEAAHQLVVAAFEAEGIESKRLLTGQLIAVHPSPEPVIVDKEACRLWCLEQGYEHDMVLSHGTLKSILGDRLLAGKPAPPGVEAYIRDKISAPRPKGDELLPKIG